MPVIVARAGDLDRTGYESKAELDADTELKARIEPLRTACGTLMGLGDVSERTFPKICLAAAPREGGLISVRSFIPHDCHAAIGVFAAVSLATACMTPGAVTDGIAQVPDGQRKTCVIEHPSGQFVTSVKLDAGGTAMERAGIVRTARKLFNGEVFVRSGLVGRAA